MKKNDPVRIIPVGGCSEIGLNMTALRICGRWYFVDCGVWFPSNDLPGVEMVIPQAEDLLAKGMKPEAWFFTHPHEDHIGALPWVYPHMRAPIYGSRMTLEFIRSKVPSDADLHELVPGRRKAFPGFSVTPLAMDHSLPEAVGLHFDTPQGGVFFTGDFRFDRARTGWENVQEFFAMHPVSLLMADSTNAMVPGRDRDEDELVDNFVGIMKETVGICVVISFASSLWRYRTVLEAARATGRRVHFLGRSMARNLDIARGLGLVKGYEDIILGDDEVAGVSRHDLCVVASGSQGEAFSGAFRLAQSHVVAVKLGPSDTVVLSARTIPGNERSVGALLNQFAKLGVRIVTARDRMVHVSGHGFQDDLRDFLRLAKPRFFAPVHGEFRHLKAHVALAEAEGYAPENCFVLENGAVIELTRDSCAIQEDRLDVRRLHVAQGVAGEARHSRDRSRLAHAGHVVTSVVVSPSQGRLVGEPQVLVSGVPVAADVVSRLCARSAAAVLKRKKKSFDVAEFSETVRLAVRRGIEEETGGFRAVVSVMVHEE